MDIYIANKEGTILAVCSDIMPNNKTLLCDKLTDTLSAGVKTFEATLKATQQLQKAAVAGNSVMVDGSPFTIITSTHSYKDGIIDIYCEDAGLEFINRVVLPVEETTKSLQDWVIATLGTEEESGWHYNFNIANGNKKLKYEVEDTALGRLLNILDNYDAELYFSYELQGLNQISKTINFIQERGDKEHCHTVYIDKQVVSITEEQTVEELATVWVLYGKNNTKLSKLSGYSSATKEFPINEKRKHSYSVVGDELRCNEGIEKWKSVLNPSGRIVHYRATEYSDATALIEYAVKEMEKHADVVKTYDIELQELPPDIRAGQYMNVLDDKDQILINARIKQWSISRILNKIEVELCDFLPLTSSIVRNTVDELAIYSISITSTNGVVGTQELSTVLAVSIFYNGNVIQQSSDLPSGLALAWYEDGQLIPDSDNRITNDGFTFTTGVLTSSHIYKCELVEVQDDSI